MKPEDVPEKMKNIKPGTPVYGKRTQPNIVGGSHEYEGVFVAHRSWMKNPVFPFIIESNCSLKKVSVVEVLSD